MTISFDKIVPYVQGLVLTSTMAAASYGIGIQKDTFTQNLVESGADINGNGSLERSEAATLINQKFVGEDGVLSDTGYKAALRYGNEMFQFDQSNYQSALKLIRLSQKLQTPYSTVEAIVDSVDPPQPRRGLVPVVSF